MRDASDRRRSRAVHTVRDGNAPRASVATDWGHHDLRVCYIQRRAAHQQTGPFKLTEIFSGNSAEARPVLQDFGASVRRAFEILRARVETEPEIRRNADNALANVGYRQTSTWRDRPGNAADS